MSFDALIFFYLTTALFVLSIVLVFVIVRYEAMLRREREEAKQIETLKTHIEQQARQITEEAKGEAEEIVKNANIRAQQIIGSGESVNLDTKKALEQTFKDLLLQSNKMLNDKAGEIVKQYEKLIGELNNKHINIFKNTTKDIENYTVSEVSDFKGILRQETVDAQKIVEQKIEEVYASAQREVEEYKKQQLERVRENIYKLLSEISKLVLGRSLDLSSQEELILQALEEAKKDGEFRV